MNNVLVTIGVLIVVVLGALFAVPQFVDWNSYRGVIEEEASRLVGRDVRIGGDIKLELLPSPSFVIHKLRVADQATVSGEPMFRADQVAARLSIVPLLRGVLEANEIELVRPVLRFVLDETGRGNWRSIGRGTGTLPFVPNDVALQSVRITDGAVLVLDRSGARERLALPQLNGQLSAPALEGPYRFRGSYGGIRELRDLRFTTLPPDAAGIVQLKAILRDAATGASATLDGKLANLAAEPSLTGELTATWPLPNTGQSETGKAGTAQSPAPQAELKAEIAGDNRRIALKNLSVAFESAGRPEVLAGEAAFAWGDQIATTLRLSAPWLDLDPVLGTPKGESPLFALAAFAQRINGLAGSGGSIDATLDIDQANLGHELVGGIRLAAQSKAGMLVVDELRAALPGGTRLEVRGSIAGQDTGTTFDGDMTLQSTSIARLGAWLAGGRAVIEPVADRPGRMRGRIVADMDRIALTSIQADIGDGRLDGQLEYIWSGVPRLAIAVDGTRVDARALLPAKASLRTLAERLLALGADGRKGRADVTVRPEVSVKLRAAEVILPDRLLSEVNVALTRRATGLAIERLQFSSSRGVSVALEGWRGTDAALELKGAVAATDPAGLATLVELFNVPDARVLDAHAADLLPLQLAGTFVLAAAAGAPLQITADGQLGAADAKIRVLLEAGIEGWHNAPVEADIVLLGARDAMLPEKLLRYLRGLEIKDRAPMPAGPLATNQSGQSRLAIRTSGRPAQGLQTAARFDSPEMTLVFNGRARAAAGAAPEIKGDLNIDARDGRDLLKAWIGLNASRLQPLAGAGSARLELSGGALTLEEITLSSATGMAMTGRLIAEALPGTNGRQKVAGALRVSSLDALMLLAPILQTSSSVVDAATAAADAGTGLWPTRSFDYGAAAQTDVHVTVRADQLVLPAGGTVQAAQFDYIVGGDSLEVRNLQGRGLDGAVTGSALLARSAKGASLAARLAVAGARLDPFGASGPADVVLELTGDGSNPSLLVSALGGKGSLVLGAAQLREITPASLQAAIETALRAAPDKVGTTLRSALTAETARVATTLGPRKIAVTVQDGVARGDPFIVGSTVGKVSGQGAFDLSTFALSGVWRVETLLAPFAASAGTTPQQAVPLPAVIQRFLLKPQDAETGRGSARAPVEVDALERELAVRKVERDLAELERLRRLDEERAAAVREKDAQAEAAAARPPESKPAQQSP